MANDPFSALAHPLRREIVERLSSGPATVGVLTRDFAVSKPTISRHLRTLEEAGVVSRVIDGRTHRLSLRSEALAETADWIDRQRERWERMFDVVGDYLDEKGAGVSEVEDRTVRIERTFAASAEDVFDAWTSAEVMRRWFHADPNWDTPVAEVDARVGGKVRVVMRSPESGDHGARGEYTVLDRPRRLEMIWWFDDDPSNEQLIELSFSESEGATTVLFVNTGIATDARRDSQDRGWNACLDELERALVG